MKNKKTINYYESETKIKTTGYIPRFPECPYLATNGNKCSRKKVGSICIYSNNVKKCPYYKLWVKTRKIDSRAVSDDLNNHQELGSN